MHPSPPNNLTLTIGSPAHPHTTHHNLHSRLPRRHPAPHTQRHRTTIRRPPHKPTAPPPSAPSTAGRPIPSPHELHTSSLQAPVLPSPWSVELDANAPPRISSSSRGGGGRGAHRATAQGPAGRCRGALRPGAPRPGALLPGPPPRRSRLLLFRVFRVYPNPNPNFRVPELSGSSFFKQISGSNFENPKFLKPELPDPKFSGYPNAQAYWFGPDSFLVATLWRDVRVFFFAGNNVPVFVWVW